MSERPQYDELASNEMTPNEGWIAAISAAAGAIATGLGLAFKAGKASRRLEDVEKELEELKKADRITNNRIDRLHWMGPGTPHP